MIKPADPETPAVTFLKTTIKVCAMLSHPL
jgi:hypothetical protein